jgi:hypothetical protein
VAGLARRSAVVAVGLTVVLLGAGAWLQYGDHRVPSGQAPLTAIHGRSLVALASDFNRDIDGTRLVLLLSPT